MKLIGGKNIHDKILHMAQIILIEPHEELSKVYALNLSTFVGADVIERKNAEDAVSILKILPEIQLIITKSKIGQEETAILIHQHIKLNGLETSLLILGECQALASEVPCLPEPVTWETLINQSAQFLGISLQEAANKIKPDYLPVALCYFYDIQKTPCDVFIRIKKGQKEYQFIKRIHSKDLFDKEVIKKYEEQGLKEFYISKDYIQYFTTFVTNNIILKLERDDLTLEDRILTTSNAYEIVKDSIQQIGLDQAAVDLSEASINSMVKSVRNSPEVVNLLKILFANKVTYAYQHCHLLALMCHYALSKQSWYKEEHLKILSFASFFSDITLKSQNQIQVSNMKELYESKLNDEEMRGVMNHAAEAEKILANHPESNEFIRTVILQSHGRLDGVGFEENPGEELHPLSKIFIIADCFVKILLNPEMPSKKQDILAILYARFTNPTYHKIMKALEQKYQ